jgi:hypothetical protein
MTDIRGNKTKRVTDQRTPQQKAAHLARQTPTNNRTTSRVDPNSARVTPTGVVRNKRPPLPRQTGMGPSGARSRGGRK